MALHLTSTELEIVRGVLSRWLSGRQVWAFGSRVHGVNLKPFSDLDLAIVGGGIDVTTLANIRDAFSESDLPFKVDLVDLTEASPEFRTAIGDQFELIQAGLQSDGGSKT